MLTNKKFQSGFFNVLFLGAVCGAVTTARAGVGTSLMQEAGVLAHGEYEATLHADTILRSEVGDTLTSGFNVSPHFRFNLVEHYLDLSSYIGTGTTDFQFGALAKYNLLPDVDGQVGVSFLGGVGVIWDTVNSSTQTSGLVTVGGVVSKSFESDNFGKVTPYGSYQLELLLTPSTTTGPMTLIAGNKWEPSEIAPWVFYSEVFLSLRKSFYGVGLGAGYKF